MLGAGCPKDNRDGRSFLGNTAEESQEALSLLGTRTTCKLFRLESIGGKWETAMENPLEAPGGCGCAGWWRWESVTKRFLLPVVNQPLEAVSLTANTHWKGAGTARGQFLPQGPGVHVFPPCPNPPNSGSRASPLPELPLSAGQ